MRPEEQRLRAVTSFEDLVDYLGEELGWPVEGFTLDEVTFTYDATHDLGLKPEEAAKVESIRQLRPLHHDQPWGVFFIEFERKRMPVVVLRRILGRLAIKQRAKARQPGTAAWHARDLLFISAFGEEGTDQREIAFAHFHETPGDLPTLRVLGWDGADTPLHVAHAAATLAAKLHWPSDETDAEAWRGRWSGAFRHGVRHTITTADHLAEVLASLARGIRAEAMTLMAHESASGPLRSLHRAFQEALIHDLTEEDFADTYAQTITYGLLTAAISRTDRTAGRHGTALIAENISDMVPITNPFLKEMLQTFLKAGGRDGGIDFDVLGVQEVVDLLRSDQTDLPAVLRDFGNRSLGEDPVIHFYEHFLSAYDKKLKVQRGVFYTPQPVVSYIVRSVHELLQTEFGLADGLADTTTWGEMIERHPDLKLPPLTDEPDEKRAISPDEPFVQILDPATGTGTFLVEVIDVIHRTLTAKWTQQGVSPAQQREQWNDYVPEHLLPRLHGYELLMAPYAIAHMKIGLKLSETGYRFGSDERARIYLTNALEPWARQLPLVGIEALAHEATAVNEVKRQKRFTVVIGNPPYSCSSSNKSAWIQSMLNDYKHGLGERKMYLDDDFIKFLRLSQHVADLSSRTALLGMITNNTYLDGITQRNMRQHLLNTFSNIQITNLHGNAREGEVAPSGAADENVFDILQGVAVTVACGDGMQSKGGAKLSYRDVWGSRCSKYRELLDRSSPTWSPVSPEPPRFAFVPSSHGLQAEYDLGVPIPALFPAGVTGVQTKRDDLVFGHSTEELRNRFDDIRSGRISLADIRNRYSARDIPEWSLDQAVRKLEADSAWHTRLAACLYRPFDIRPLFYSGDFIARDRHEVMRHMLHPNLALVITRQSNPTEPWSELLVTDRIVEKRALASYSGEARAYPLYLADEKGLGGSPANVSEIASGVFGERLGWQVTEPAYARLMLNYVYAVGHSPTFRNRYETLIRRDYLRIPVTSDGHLAKLLAHLGGELVALHLLESPLLDQPITEFIGRSREVTKVGYTDGTVWVNASGTKASMRAGTSGFRGVPETVWNFHIGGYQVCEKWLKDRKGRTLSDEDIAHYHKIVVALTETIRLMAEIDEVIDQHGGWPDAFSSA